MERISKAYAQCLLALANMGFVLLLLMMVIIVADVMLRNIKITGLPSGLAWSNEVSEMLLYLIAMLLAPWLLRQGQHIRVDIVLQAVPPQLAWYLECLGDLLAMLCCWVMAWYSAISTLHSYESGSLNIKTLVTPEWWSLCPLPLIFVLLSIEMVFRMHRLLTGPKGPRHDAVSAS
jgi:TRAP-type C4-dicarboxylate transport system permease small subunit